MADDKLTGLLVGGSGGETTEYKPFDENARMAIYGYNPSTGKAFTPEESRAVNGGYDPNDVSGGAVGYRIDPVTKQLQVLLGNGTVSGYGQYTQTAKGGIVPNLPSNWGAFQYDDYGRPINAQGQPITNEDIRKYNELVAYDPAAAKEFAAGKGIAVADGQPLTGSGAKDNSGSSAFTTQSTGATGGNLGNPYTPGTQQYADFNSRKSAYDILFQEFNRYGLGSMVEPLKSLITEGVSPSEFGLRLTQTDAYKKRFAANQDRINKGLRALTPAEYIGLEDQYQSIMRNYGLPASYYTKGDLGTQEGFNKLLASDVSAAELEDRIATAQKRVLNTNPEVLQALKQFYPDLNNADILAYTLDPDKALSEIQRKVTAAEIGGAALAQGLQAQGGTAEALAGYGITKAQAQQGYQTIGEFLPTAEKLGDIYSKQGLGAYNQSTAEQEVFGTAGAAEAARKRKRLAQLEQATFSGQAGASQGALSRERQGTF